MNIYILLLLFSFNIPVFIQVEIANRMINGLNLTGDV